MPPWIAGGENLVRIGCGNPLGVGGEGETGMPHRRARAARTNDPASPAGDQAVHAVPSPLRFLKRFPF